MTLNEVFIHAGDMTATERWAIFTACGSHDVRALPRTTTVRQDGPQYYCRSCWTVFGAGSFRIWNPPVRPQIDRRAVAAS